MQKIRGTGYLLILIFGAALTTAFVWRPAPPARFTGLGALAIPSSVSGFTGQEVPVDAVTKNALSSAEVTARDYVKGSRTISLLLIGGTDRSALHDPRSCLVGQGMKIDKDRVEELQPGDVPARTCTATMQDASGQAGGYDILYVYVTHRRVIASATEIRLALLESALLEQNDSPVYFIRLITKLAPSSDYAAEHAQLKDFASDFWGRLSPSLMKEERS